MRGWRSQADTEPATPPSTEPVPLPAETVSVVYRALLGREPDPEGLRHWVETGSLERLVSAAADTEEHRRRVALQSALAGDAQPGGAGGLAHRLEAGDGLVALDTRPVSPEVLATFPWEEVADPWAELPALVLGPYGRQLADELVGRGAVAAARAGLSCAGDGVVDAVGVSRTGTLVLTDEAYVHVLSEHRADVVESALLRIVHPVHISLGTPIDEMEVAVRVARRRLHALGFVEVAQVIGRRFGAGTTVIDLTHTTPDLDQLHVVGRTPFAGDRRPTAVWLVGRRVPVEDRP